MIYEYECNMGHVNEIISGYVDKPEVIGCECGQISKPIVSLAYVTTIFGNGKKIGDHIAYDNREFKNYREMDKYLDKKGLEPYTLTKAQVKQRQEERRHRKSKPTISTKDSRVDFNLSNDASNKLEQLKNHKHDKTKQAKDIIMKELN